MSSQRWAGARWAVGHKGGFKRENSEGVSRSSHCGCLLGWWGNQEGSQVSKEPYLGIWEVT